MNNNNGGPAFPAGVVRKSRPIHDPGAGFVVTDITEPRHHGITMRDYFAAKAMQTLIQCVWERSGDSNYIIDSDGRVSLHLRAYEHADAMLAEREKGNSK